MFSAVNPLMLWGLAGIAVPILIHLLMRQRPRPRPWAVMQWLMAAMKAAQRRYKLTNLLLLLLRCLAIAALAMAVARPSLAGLGQGGNLVLVVDLSASMGPTAEGGALKRAHEGLSNSGLEQRQVRLVTVGRSVQMRLEGLGDEVLQAISRLEPDMISGGLDRASSGDMSADLLDAIPRGSDVLLISDFRQDSAESLQAVLANHAGSVRRWRVGNDGGNALVQDIRPADDLLPGRPGILLVDLQGRSSGGSLTINDGAPTPVTFLASKDAENAEQGQSTVRLALPPLPAGRHDLRLELDDNGLQSDNRVDFTALVRDRVATLAVEGTAGFSYLSAAIAADGQRLSVERIRSTALAVTELPQGGFISLREPPLKGERLAQWVRNGGVLWTTRELIAGNSALAPLMEGLSAVGDAIPGGPLSTGIAEVDISFSRVTKPSITPVSLPKNVEVLLRSGELPAVVALPVGRGWMIIEVDSLADWRDFRTAAATPSWVTHTIRAYTMRLHNGLRIESGSPAPMDLNLERSGNSLTFTKGEPVLASAGLWQHTDSANREETVIVLPNRREGVLRSQPNAVELNQLTSLLPQDRGADWGWYLLLAACLVLMGEGLYAAWAGKTYGR